MGFRLPWTVTDEDIWILCHRRISYLTLPVLVLYVAGVLALPGRAGRAIVAAILVWAGSSAALAGLFFCRKFHPKT